MQVISNIIVTMITMGFAPAIILVFITVIASLVLDFSLYNKRLIGIGNAISKFKIIEILLVLVVFSLLIPAWKALGGLLE